MIAAIEMAAEMADAEKRDDVCRRCATVIAAHGLAAKKSLGQNFLLDLNLTRRIARAAGAGEGGDLLRSGARPRRADARAAAPKARAR